MLGYIAVTGQGPDESITLVALLLMLLMGLGLLMYLVSGIKHILRKFKK